MRLWPWAQFLPRVKLAPWFSQGTECLSNTRLSHWSLNSHSPPQCLVTSLQLSISESFRRGYRNNQTSGNGCSHPVWFPRVSTELPGIRQVCAFVPPRAFHDACVQSVFCVTKHPLEDIWDDCRVWGVASCEHLLASSGKMILDCNSWVTWQLCARFKKWSRNCFPEWKPAV